MALTPVSVDAVREAKGSHEKMRQPRRVPIARCVWSWLNRETEMLILCPPHRPNDALPVALDGLAAERGVNNFSYDTDAWTREERLRVSARRRQPAGCRVSKCSDPPSLVPGGPPAVGLVRLVVPHVLGVRPAREPVVAVNALPERRREHTALVAPMLHW